MSKIEISAPVWQVFEPFVQDFRPRNHQLRDIVSGILWILTTGSQWKHLPSDYPPKSTCYFWYCKFLYFGVFEQIFHAVVQVLEAQGKIDLEECSIDATFIRARATLDNKGKTKCGKGHKLMAIVDKKSKPIALFLTSASPHEITLLQETVDRLATEGNPVFMLGDKAYDSDDADEKLQKQGIALVSPHRKNRAKPKTQDGRTLRRYKRRWKVEQFFAHLHNYRKITLCYEKYSARFFGFVQFAAIILIIGKI